MSSTNISIIIQARLGSKRLPGKVLKELIPGRSMLSLMLERTCRSKLATQIIVATSDQENDRAIVEEAKKAGCSTFCGSEHDVLERYVEAAKKFNCDVIVRLSADSPLLDAEIIDACIQRFMDSYEQVDYVSNLMPETFPYGMAVEVFSADVLMRIDRLSKDLNFREHVTLYARQHPDLFKMMNVEHHENWSQLRWAVDYPEDFEFVRSVYARLYAKKPLFSWLDIVEITAQDKPLETSEIQTDMELSKGNLS